MRLLFAPWRFGIPRFEDFYSGTLVFGKHCRERVRKRYLSLGEQNHKIAKWANERSVKILNKVARLFRFSHSRYPELSRLKLCSSTIKLSL